jgi:hypothetical protein
MCRTGTSELPAKSGTIDDVKKALPSTGVAGWATGEGETKSVSSKVTELSRAAAGTRLRDTATINICRCPLIFAALAFIFEFLQNADLPDASPPVDVRAMRGSAIPIATIIATLFLITAALFLLPRKDDFWNADWLAFHVVAVLGLLFRVDGELAHVFALRASDLTTTRTAVAGGVATMPAGQSGGHPKHQYNRSDKTVEKTHFCRLLYFISKRRRESGRKTSRARRLHKTANAGKLS